MHARGVRNAVYQGIFARPVVVVRHHIGVLQYEHGRIVEVGDEAAEHVHLASPRAMFVELDDLAVLLPDFFGGEMPHAHGVEAAGETGVGHHAQGGFGAGDDFLEINAEDDGGEVHPHFGDDGDPIGFAAGDGGEDAFLSVHLGWG